MQALSGRTHGSGKRPRLTSGLQGASCWGRTVSIDSAVRTFDHLNDSRHSHPSVIHSCAIPILPPFLRPLRHSCGGRNPCDCPTVRRASIRPTAHQSPQRPAGDRAPSNIGSALDPTDRMDSCLRRNDGGGRNDGQAGVTEGGRPRLARYSHARESGPQPPSAPCLRRGRLRHLAPQSGWSVIQSFPSWPSRHPPARSAACRRRSARTPTPDRGRRRTTRSACGCARLARPSPG